MSSHNSTGSVLRKTKPLTRSSLCHCQTLNSDWHWQWQNARGMLVLDPPPCPARLLSSPLLSSPQSPSRALNSASLSPSPFGRALAPLAPEPTCAALRIASNATDARARRDAPLLGNLRLEKRGINLCGIDYLRSGPLRPLHVNITIFRCDECSKIRIPPF